MLRITLPSSFFRLCLMFLIVSPLGLRAQSLSPDTWTRYCGWHYANTSLDWGGWCREYAKDAFGLFIADSQLDELDSLALQASYQTLVSADSSLDLLQLDGGLGSARDTAKVIEYMDLIESDGGQTWRDMVYTQSLQVAQIYQSRQRVYWQIGNEISSPAYSRTIRYWQGQSYSNGLNYDLFTIPYYVEYYLAPTVAGIDSASQSKYGQKGQIKICLGSLTNAHNAGAAIFLDSLLNYEVTGTYAPGLAGKKVYELVHLITVHYTMGTAQSSSWRSTMDGFKSWAGTGRIRGVWSTEEVGINAALNGGGSFVSSIATTRYLEWAIDNQYPAREARTNYFGWNTGPSGTTVNDFNTFLYSHLGDSRLANVDSTALLIGSTNGTESHRFLTSDGAKGLAVIFPERLSAPTNSATLDSIVLDLSQWGGVQQVALHTYDHTGINSVSFSSSQSGSSLTLTFSSPLVLSNREGLAILLETGPILSRQAPDAHTSWLRLSPNPTHARATVSWSSEVWKESKHLAIEIRNLQGQVLQKEYRSAGQAEAFTSRELPAGTYFVSLLLDGSLVETAKLLVQ